MTQSNSYCFTIQINKRFDIVLFINFQFKANISLRIINKFMNRLIKWSCICIYFARILIHKVFNIFFRLWSKCICIYLVRILIHKVFNIFFRLWSKCICIYLVRILIHKVFNIFFRLWSKCICIYLVYLILTCFYKN